MSFGDFKKKFFGSDEEYEDQYIDDGPDMVNKNNGAVEEEADDTADDSAKKNRVVNVHATTQIKVVLVKPETFEEASTIADHRGYHGR